MNWKKFNNAYWFELISVFLLALIGNFFDFIYFPQIIVAVLTTALIDSAITYFKNKKVHVSKSAVISGLLIGSILQQASLWIFVFAGAAAVISKHSIRIKNLSVFNPAAFGVLASTLIFSAADAWWSAGNMIPVLILGLPVVWKMGKSGLVFSFLALFFILSLVMLAPTQGFSFENASFSFLNLPFFLAFFMLTEPKTTPHKKQVLFGLAFAAMMFALLFAGIQSFLLVGLLLGNLIYALYRKRG